MSEPGASGVHAHRCRNLPDAKTILNITRVVGPDVIEQLHRRVVDVAKRAGVTNGRGFASTLDIGLIERWVSFRRPRCVRHRRPHPALALVFTVVIRLGGLLRECTLAS